MKFTTFDIQGPALIEPKVWEDARGFFFESYREDLFARQDILERFVQDNHSFSRQGVLRGLHYQLPYRAQAKLIRVVRGEVLDVAVDIRKKSKTFGRSISVILSAENKKEFFIPVGFAHGYLTLSPEAEVLYKTTDLYAPDLERGILWSDPALKIDWPKLDVPYLLAEKDKKYPLLKDAEVF